jgi:hypothetical protein
LSFPPLVEICLEVCLLIWELRVNWNTIGHYGTPLSRKKHWRENKTHSFWKIWLKVLMFLGKKGHWKYDTCIWGRTSTRSDISGCSKLAGVPIYPVFLYNTCAKIMALAFQVSNTFISLGAQ